MAMGVLGGHVEYISNGLFYSLARGNSVIIIVAKEHKHFLRRYGIILMQKRKGDCLSAFAMRLAPERIGEREEQ